MLPEKLNFSPLSGRQIEADKCQGSPARLNVERDVCPDDSG